MRRLIDANALWMDIIHAMDYCDDILEIIERQPTVEERKKGKWNMLRENIFNCRNCGTTFTVLQGKNNMYFCPNCGAYMRG